PIYAGAGGQGQPPHPRTSGRWRACPVPTDRPATTGRAELATTAATTHSLSCRISSCLAGPAVHVRSGADDCTSQLDCGPAKSSCAAEQCHNNHAHATLAGLATGKPLVRPIHHRLQLPARVDCRLAPVRAVVDVHVPIGVSLRDDHAAAVVVPPTRVRLVELHGVRVEPVVVDGGLSRVEL